MRKNVLVLSGSPRKNGNSDMLCDAFIKGAEKAGHLTEKIFIQNKKIFPCLACYGCRNTHLCVQKDDSLSGQLKTLIDRTLPQYTQIANKDFYFMATAAAGKKSMERTMDALRGFTDCLPNANIKGYVYGAGVYEKGEIEYTSYLKLAYDMGINS